MRIRQYVAAGVVAVVVAGAVLWAPALARAQALGTFSWQLQPFCNVVTVNVMQTGAVYTLSGYDDQCGAAQRAPLVGLATPNPDGTIGFGLHIVTVPGGADVSVEARITLAALGGSWRDSAGNSGTFAFGGAAAGSPRPAPSTAPAWGTLVAAPASAPSAGITVQRSTLDGSSNAPALMVEWGTPLPPPAGGAGIYSSSRDGVAINGRSSTSYGVIGRSDLNFGVLGIGGVLASGGPLTPALQLDGGGVTVSGSTRPAFVHTAAAGNIIGIRTVINHPLLNGRSNAIVTASHVYDVAVGFIPGGIGVLYDAAAGRWSIVRQDSLAMPVGARFNVIVFNQ
jgi:hypothetical protein